MSSESSKTPRARLDPNPSANVEQVLDILVQQMVEELVEVPKIVSQYGNHQRIVEQTVGIPVPQVTARGTFPTDFAKQHGFSDCPKVAGRSSWI